LRDSGHSVLIAPVGIEMNLFLFHHVFFVCVLIAPVGIEMKKSIMRRTGRPDVLIAPVGIEIHFDF